MDLNILAEVESCYLEGYHIAQNIDNSSLKIANKFLKYITHWLIFEYSRQDTDLTEEFSVH